MPKKRRASPSPSPSPEKNWTIHYDFKIPPTWVMDEHTSFFLQNPITKIVEIAPETPLFQNIETLFYQNLPSRSSAKLLCVEQVQNIKNFAHYCTEATAIHNDFILKKYPEREIEKWLWHGTSMLNLDSLLRGGFDKVYLKREMFGKGFYFSHSSRIAGQSNYAKPATSDSFHLRIHQYFRELSPVQQPFFYTSHRESAVDQESAAHCPPKKKRNADKLKFTDMAKMKVIIPELPSETRVLLLCRVLVGKSLEVSDRTYAHNKEAMKLLPIGFHSSINAPTISQQNIQKGDYTVIYNPCQIYPEYICYFKVNPEFEKKYKVFENLNPIQVDPADERIAADSPAPTPPESIDLLKPVIEITSEFRKKIKSLLQTPKQGDEAAEEDEENGESPPSSSEVIDTRDFMTSIHNHHDAKKKKMIWNRTSNMLIAPSSSAAAAPP
jgi:hypothetical protein